MEDLKTRLNKLTKINDYRFKFQSVKKIIETLKNELSQANAFDQAIKIDSKYQSVNFDEKKLIDIIDEFINKDKLYVRYTTTEIVDGYGNIAVYYDGDPYLTLRLALKALRTHNNMVFFAKKYYAINSKIIETINLISKEENYATKIASVEYNIIDATIFQNQSFFDLFIYVGDKRVFQSYRQRLSIPYRYCGYGNVDVFVENKGFKDLLLDINRFAYENNININYYNDTSVEETILFLNKYDVNDCCVLLSKNTEIIYKFISEIKSKNIYVNKNPFDDYKLTLKEKDLVYKKYIIMN